jgi:hypothetical protein
MQQGFAGLLNVVKVYKGLLLITLNVANMACWLSIQIQKLRLQQAIFSPR